MKKVGIVLIVIQVLAVVGGIVNGNIADMLSSGTSGIISLIGFFLPAIIGLILLAKANGKTK